MKKYILITKKKMLNYEDRRRVRLIKFQSGNKSKLFSTLRNNKEQNHKILDLLQKRTSGPEGIKGWFIIIFPSRTPGSLFLLQIIPKRHV